MRQTQRNSEVYSLRYFFFSTAGAGPAGKPFSAIIFIASLTGIWAMPLPLSIHSNFSLASESS
jgi:hypothetical protein